MCKIFVTFISLLYIVVLTSPALAASSGPITSETALDTAISGGSTPLNIAGNIALSGSKAIGYAAGLAGNGGKAYTISGDNTFQLFRFNNNADGISNLTFNQGSAPVRGGAMYVVGNLNGISQSTFTNNKVTNENLSSNGGAIYVGGNLLNISQSTFSNNICYGGTGGAVFVGNDLQNGISQSTFTNNISQHGSSGAVYVRGNMDSIVQSTFTNNIGNGGNGGAVYVGGILQNGVSQSTFSGNLSGEASGGALAVNRLRGSITNSSFTDNTSLYGGGALFIVSGFTGEINQSIFKGNRSLNGVGGALYAGNEGLQADIINSTFTQNSAQNTGGALHIYGDISSNISGSSFTDNSAGAYGGAIFANQNLELSGANARFTGNQALGVAGDESSGLGGAIFHSGRSSSASDLTFKLSATPGAPIIFEGNTQSPGQSGAVPNSIYFGNNTIMQYVVYNPTVSATFDVAQGGALHLLDPMASQKDDFTYPDPRDPLNSLTLNNLALTINKTGPGTLILAGHNDMQSATNWVVSEGALHMVADKGAQRAHINLANTSNALGAADYASFTLKSGARLLVEPATTPHLISGQNITLESGSSAGLLGFRYGAHLPDGRYVMLTLDAPNVDNQSAVPQTSGTIAIGAYDYTYQNLGWQRQDHDLVVDLEERVLHPVRSGQPSITGSSHIAAKNPAFSAFSYHTKCLFDNWDRFSYQDENAVGLPQDLCLGSNYLNHLWIAPSYVNINQSASGNNTGYLLQTAAVAMGYDRQLSENAFAGIGLSLSWPDYSGGDTEINASDITFGIYGGVRLPYALELDGHAGFGFTRFDQERQVHNERYSEKYSGNSFFVGLGLGRPFALGSNFSLRPGVYYNFIHLNTDGFTEPHGTYAIKSDDYSQDIHRLKAGVSLSWKEPSTCLILRGEVYYLGMYGDHEAETVGYFVNHPENGFPMLGNGLDRDSLGLGLNVSLPVSERWEFGAGYNVLFGADTVSQEGHLSAIFKF